MREFVILVDENDNAVGTCEKIEAHQKAKLHRAFSVFIFNKNGEMLIHQRAIQKYHSGGLWTNACCGHPRQGELTHDAAKRRLNEEMGIDTELTFKFKFVYKANLDNTLTEHEVDHVFVGFYDKPILLNRDEVMNAKWINPNDLIEKVNSCPNEFTEWFKLCYKKVIEQ